MQVQDTRGDYARTYERVGALGDGLPDPAQMSALAVRWLEAWNTHDLDAIIDCTTEDIVMDDPTAFGGVARGQAEVRRFCGDFLQAFPDIHFETGPPYTALEGAGIAVSWRMSGTFTNDFAIPSAPKPIAPTGRHFSVEGMDLYGFRDGRVCWWRLYYDGYTMAQQLGLLPPVDGRALRLLAPLQRLGAARMRRAAARAAG
jgi:steroid delta-isomerase-like uncharacterized protein